MKFAIGTAIFCVALGGLFFFFHPRVVTFTASPDSGGKEASAQGVIPLPQIPSSTSPVPRGNSSGLPAGGQDIAPPGHLPNPPIVVRGLYLTGWSAGSEKKVDSIIALMKEKGLNAVVVDIKDYSGYVSYRTGIPEVAASGAENEIRIARPNEMLKKFHDQGIYVIGRITNFQDPILAKAHPEWALKNKATGAAWTDNHGLAWMDPAARPVWEYLAAIAKDGFSRGFDEMQFDYIRFASDGSLGNIAYPYWNQKTPRAAVIANYFKFLRESFPNQKISADLFGLATVNSDDLGIGQVIQSAYEYFDYVSPMVYPSHYAPGFLGYQNPAKYPYEVVDYSMAHALQKLLAMGLPPASASSTASSSVPVNVSFRLGFVPNSKLRPWLQSFNLGAVYTSAMVQSQIDAVHNTLETGSSTGQFGGWLLWDAANVYSQVKNL